MRKITGELVKVFCSLIRIFAERSFGEEVRDKFVWQNANESCFV